MAVPGKGGLAGFQIHGYSTRPFLTQRTMAGIDIQHFDVNGKMALSAKTTTSERLHGILLMTESTSREKASPERTGFVFRLQQN